MTARNLDLLNTLADAALINKIADTIENLGRMATPVDLLDELDIVDITEIARRLEVEKGTVDKWRHRQILPTPDLSLAVGPLWIWTTIRAWALATGRLPSVWDRTEAELEARP